MSTFSAAQRQAAVNSVKPLIGTDGSGMTFPAVGAPFGMTQWTPQTREGERKCVAPYYAADTRIQGFRGSHFLSGSRMQDHGSVTLMPLSGTLKVDPKERASTFLRETEVLHPSSYSIELKDYGIHADITGSVRSGFLRFRFDRGGKSWILVQNNSVPEMATYRSTKPIGRSLVETRRDVFMQAGESWRGSAWPEAVE